MNITQHYSNNAANSYSTTPLLFQSQLCLEQRLHVALYFAIRLHAQQTNMRRDFGHLFQVLLDFQSPGMPSTSVLVSRSFSLFHWLENEAEKTVASLEFRHFCQDEQFSCVMGFRFTNWTRISKFSLFGYHHWSSCPDLQDWTTASGG